jgi:magnesium-transporting ATPase (P-type)
LSEDGKKKIMHEVVAENYAKKAYRTLLIAYTEISFEEYKNIKHQNNNFSKEEDREVLERNMTVIGIYALMDPLRDEIV